MSLAPACCLPKLFLRFAQKICSFKTQLVREQVLLDCRSSRDGDLGKTVWAKTCGEVERGWLIGPYNFSEVPISAPLSRRFGLKQKHDKIRLIDDFSESRVNSAVSVCEPLVLHTVDVAGSLLVFWFQACSSCVFVHSTCPVPTDR